jgi:hypothetical protein
MMHGSTNIKGYLIVASISNGRQTEVHTAEPRVDDPAEVEMDNEKFKGFKLPYSDHIQMELMEVHGESFHFQIHKLFETKKTEASHLHKSVQSHKPEFLSVL